MSLLRALRQEMRTSDWAYYGITYASIFAVMVSVGSTAMWYIGPSEDAEERRKQTRKEFPRSPLSKPGSSPLSQRSP
jgi:hypothetical protein